MIKNIVYLKNHKLFSDLRKFKSYFVTTPIYYSNEKPHIGHLYTNCIADCLARWNRLKGNTVVFSTGTDDHGIKIQRTANSRNVVPQDLVNEASIGFKNLFDSADISFTKFIRTSDNNHKSNVQHFWKLLMSKGFLSKEIYSGWYSTVDETFVSDSSLKKSASLENNEKLTHSLEWFEEDNWVFHISKFKDHIHEWIDSGVIYPSHLIPMIKHIIDETNVVALSRPSNRVSWGIPVPEDSSQTIYVWFDALINYLTASKLSKELSWPADLQVIGKDIIRFHTVLWPAILLALEMELPKQILIHSHWLHGGVKMSKSLGNVVDPQVESNILGGYEQLKYFLLSEDAINNDTTYCSERAVSRINSDLVNITGNLLSRITSIKLNPLQCIGIKHKVSEQMFTGTQFSELMDKLSLLRSIFESHMDHLHIHLAIQCIINVLRETNVFIDSQKPWLQSVDQYTKDAIIYVSAESLRMCSILLQCFVPILAHKILIRLGVKVKNSTLAQVQFNTICPNIRSITKTKKDFVLLERLDEIKN